MCERALEYFKRSFFAVDGLWFMMIEEATSFDKALEIDKKVWRVMPKIQCKKLREIYDLQGNTLRDLAKAVTIKLSLEGYKADIEDAGEDRAIIKINECPWYNIMKKSGREKLAARVGEKICSVEYQGWAECFDKKIRFTLSTQLCKGAEPCQLEFKKTSPSTT